MNHTPILYSFRRCPYAMRARLAIASAQIEVEHREILLRDKPAEFLAASPSGTVPLVIAQSAPIDESLDVMFWALSQNDPEGWLAIPACAHELIATADSEFKTALDRYKYASRIAGAEPDQERQKASAFLSQLDGMLADQDWLFAGGPTLADMAILPFVRQFAHVDLEWFEQQPWPNLVKWLDAFKFSDRFATIMKKHPIWQSAASPKTPEVGVTP